MGPLQLVCIATSSLQVSGPSPVELHEEGGRHHQEAWGTTAVPIGNAFEHIPLVV